jgi:cation transport ATPase
MSTAAVGAALIGELAEAGSAMFLFSLAQLLEARSMDRARNAIRGLLDLSPTEATVRKEEGDIRLPVDRIQVGDVVLLRPGERVPVDGVVLEGASSVNQAPITGESVPVAKTPGSRVLAGSLNGGGVLDIRAEKPASDSSLARIIHLVEKSQAQRTRSQTFIDGFARYYTPAMIVFALGSRNWAGSGRSSSTRQGRSRGGSPRWSTFGPSAIFPRTRSFAWPRSSNPGPNIRWPVPSWTPPGAGAASIRYPRRRSSRRFPAWESGGR